MHAIANTDSDATGGFRRFAGVDGCPAGWIVALSPQHGGPHRLHICPTFREVLALVGDSGIVVADIPIGLLYSRQAGGRQVDRDARKMLGPRRSSVFSPPTRPALRCRQWATARKCGLNRQSFAIMPKIREVDQLMTPALQRRVIESHPRSSVSTLGRFTDGAQQEAERRPP
jgi:predicted RNase H-like nuclease